MAEWGVRTWDTNGVDNNTGIVRVLVIGTLAMSSAQQTGSVSFTVPAGYVLDYFFQSTQDGYVAQRRKITVSGGNASISAVGNSDWSANTSPANSGTYLFYFRIP